ETTMSNIAPELWRSRRAIKSACGRIGSARVSYMTLVDRDGASPSAVDRATVHAFAVERRGDVTAPIHGDQAAVRAECRDCGEHRVTDATDCTDGAGASRRAVHHPRIELVLLIGVVAGAAPGIEERVVLQLDDCGAYRVQGAAAFRQHCMPGIERLRQALFIARGERGGHLPARHGACA